jgi:integrase
MKPTEGWERPVNHPLAALFDQFVKERHFLKNVTPKTLTWYDIAYRNYRAVVPDDALPSKASLQALVIALRERGIRPVTTSTYIAAMNAFCVWLHQEGHLAVPLKLQKLRVEKRVLTLLDDMQMRALIRFRPRTFRHVRQSTTAGREPTTGYR